MSAKPPETGGFLDRWSRRKRAVAAGIEAPEAEPTEAAPAPPQAMPEPEQAAQEAGPEPEEFVEPPPLESIGPDFDLSHWLRQKVPEAWKRQALRQAWSADPAIRDFKGLADYDLDYNTPGMAPGYGPLTESDGDIAAMARRIFGEPEPDAAAAEPPRDPQPQAADAVAQDPSSVSEHAPAASQRDAEAVAASALTQRGEEAAADGANRPGTPAIGTERHAAMQHHPAELRENSQPVVRIRRRGGGATPA